MDQSSRAVKKIKCSFGGLSMEMPDCVLKLNIYIPKFTQYTGSQKFHVNWNHSLNPHRATLLSAEIWLY